MASTVGDLCVYRLHPALVASALLNAKRNLMLPGVPLDVDLVAVGARRERLKPKIDPDCIAASALAIGNLTNDVETPPAPSILRYGPRLRRPAKVARAPNAEPLFEKMHSSVGEPRRPIERGAREPTQALAALGGPEARRLGECRLSGVNEPLAYR